MIDDNGNDNKTVSHIDNNNKTFLHIQADNDDNRKSIIQELITRIKYLKEIY